MNKKENTKHKSTNKEQKLTMEELEAVVGGGLASSPIGMKRKK